MANIEMKNRKAYFDYEIIEKYDAGIVLVGSEIKSIRKGEVTFTDSYCIFSEETELFVKSLHIANFENVSFNAPDTKRDRKLLLTKKELIKLQDKVQIKGYTIIPLKMYIKDGWAKLQIGMVKGKKKQDKRLQTKNREWEIEKDRILKNNF